MRVNERIISLLYKKVNAEFLNEAEQKELDDWITKSPHNRSVCNCVTNQDDLQEEIKKCLRYDSKSLWKKISSRISSKQNIAITLFTDRPLQFTAAILLIGMPIYAL